MSYGYGALGTSPLTDLPETVEHLIAEFLKLHYDESITGVPVNKILWEQWFSGATGDYGIYLQDVNHSNVANDISWHLEEYDHYTDIHVFARSTHDDYMRSSERKLFQFSNMIKKIIAQNRTELQNKGIQALKVENERNVLVSDDKTDIKRKIITVWSRISLVS